MGAAPLPPLNSIPEEWLFFHFINVALPLKKKEKLTAAERDELLNKERSKLIDWSCLWFGGLACGRHNLLFFNHIQQLKRS